MKVFFYYSGRIMILLFASALGGSVFGQKNTQLNQVNAGGFTVPGHTTQSPIDFGNKTENPALYDYKMQESIKAGLFEKEQSEIALETKSNKPEYSVNRILTRAEELHLKRSLTNDPMEWQLIDNELLRMNNNQGKSDIPAEKINEENDTPKVIVQDMGTFLIINGVEIEKIALADQAKELQISEEELINKLSK